MAYAATITRTEKTVSGRRYLIVEVAETEAAATSEFEIDSFPFETATVVKYQATLTAGTGTTINPTMGKATGWTASTQNHIGTQSTTAAYIDDETTLTFHLDTGSVFVQSTPNNATADHSISTVIVFVEGWVA